MESKKEIMIDIETLDIGPRSIVLSIGVVDFTQEQGSGYSLYMPLKLQQQINFGRTISESTLLWWAGQDREAFESAFQTQNRTGVGTALNRLTNFIDCAKTCSNALAVPIWANSPSFDLVILGTLYDDFGMSKLPWSYRDARDLRTLRDAAGLSSDWKPDNISVMAHFPVDDCRHQIEVVREARRRLAGFASTGSA